MPNPERAISVIPIHCEGRPAKIGETPPLFDKPVEVLVVTFENGTTKVGCPYITPDSKCSAGKTQPKKSALPFCSYSFTETSDSTLPKKTRGIPKGSILVDGNNIKSLRERLGLTQEELANQANLDKSFLSRIESGSRKSLKKDKIESLATSFGVSPEDLKLKSL
ncbi:MAG TPA: helix-turn-helix transcriptional regulator [Xanthomonadales bacterium]|nr:helix-turn-helix transcriptional regulator [Xanthomonadales bacterium]